MPSEMAQASSRASSVWLSRLFQRHRILCVPSFSGITFKAITTIVNVSSSLVFRLLGHDSDQSP
ncbi:hypothetical protein EGR_09592 [Echinococcus granulosus]|uniref:Uncharacterized protein n=1 Tax=Echinococcus granulosus TaxID=6210 RepID=W6U363_ECHGR|nr:hypothetical protein EGR_09592 [Echinococcus granulosus]EUB55555.1 hypothetical protein EGR_09592 [Echinococcus granulosus]